MDRRRASVGNLTSHGPYLVNSTSDCAANYVTPLRKQIIHHPLQLLVTFHLHVGLARRKNYRRPRTLLSSASYCSYQISNPMARSQLVSCIFEVPILPSKPIHILREEMNLVRLKYTDATELEYIEGEQRHRARRCSYRETCSAALGIRFFRCHRYDTWKGCLLTGKHSHQE